MLIIPRLNTIIVVYQRFHDTILFVKMVRYEFRNRTFNGDKWSRLKILSIIVPLAVSTDLDGY